MDLFNQALQVLQSGSYVPQARHDPYYDMHHEEQFLELPSDGELLSEPRQMTTPASQRARYTAARSL